MNNEHEYLEHDVELIDKLVKIYKDVKYDLYFLNGLYDDFIDRRCRIIVNKYMDLLDCDIDTAAKIAGKVSNYISSTEDIGGQYVL